MRDDWPNLPEEVRSRLLPDLDLEALDELLSRLPEDARPQILELFTEPRPPAVPAVDSALHRELKSHDPEMQALLDRVYRRPAG